MSPVDAFVNSMKALGDIFCINFLECRLIGRWINGAMDQWAMANRLLLGRALHVLDVITTTGSLLLATKAPRSSALVSGGLPLILWPMILNCQWIS